MAFRYALQTLLRLRTSLERQEEQRLLAAGAVVGRLRAEIEHLQEGHARVWRETLLDLEQGSSGAAVQFLATCQLSYEHARKKLDLQVADAEKKRQQRLREYQAIRQKREILQGLRDRQEAAYNLEFARHEQQTIDEAFLIRQHLSRDE